ncbi:unnamed protein product, partial [Closterium sp. NIES-54]
ALPVSRTVGRVYFEAPQTTPHYTQSAASLCTVGGVYFEEIAWHLICDLATAQCDGALPVSRTVSGAKLFMVQPFV